jgi:hypothetical protein
VIRLGLRMTLRGGVEAAIRLLLTAVAVTVGVMVLVAVAADFRAFQVASNRPCWECTHSVEGTAGTELWHFSEDYFEGRVIKRLDVAPLDASAPIPPGLSRLSRDGEYFVSPALATLLAETPHDQLADRFPGVEAGLLGDAALAGPDDLVVVVGRTAAALKDAPDTMSISAIDTQPMAQGTTTMYRFGFGLAAIALILPLIIFVGTATRLAAARREERYAAMRLVGSSTRQINIIASIDAGVGALFGTAAGIAGFLLIRSAVAKVPVTGARFFDYQVTPTIWGYATVAVGVPVISVAAALWSLRQVRISPLGVSRRVTPPQPRLWRVLPLLAGIGLFVAGVMAPDTGPQEAIVYPSLVLVMLGLVIAGPWLTRQAARLLSTLAEGPASLLAARRLADNPRAAFRTVSGLTMAVFVGTAIAVLLPGLVTKPGTGGDPALRDVLRVQYGIGLAEGISPQRSAEMLKDLQAYAGATVIPIYLLPPEDQPQIGPGAPPPGPRESLPPNSVVDCARLAALPVLGHCAPGVTAVELVAPNLFVDNPGALRLPIVDSKSIAYTGSLAGLNLGTLVVKTADAATLERVRTYLSTHASIPGAGLTPEEWLTNAWTPSTFGEVADLRRATYDAIERIALAAIVLTLLVAGCSIAVSTGGGMVERKRPFTLLRLTGMPMSRLAWVIVLESTLPLLATAVVAAVTGYVLAAAVTTLSTTGHAPIPGGTYFLTIGAGLAVSLAVIMATIPLLGRITRSDSARFE